MRTGDLHQRHQCRVRHAAREMHTRQVEPVSHLGEEDLFPAAARLRLGAIADTVAAHDHHLRPRPCGQHLGQCAQEAVIAAIGFQIAVDEADGLMARRQHTPSGQCEGGSRVRCHGVGVHPVMDHLDHAAQGRRKAVGLPPGRRDPGIGMQQRLPQMRGAALCDHRGIQ